MQVVPGELTIITGVPNSGKSEWIDALMVNLADRFGWRFGLCSMEKKVSHPLQPCRLCVLYGCQGIHPCYCASAGNQSHLQFCRLLYSMAAARLYTSATVHQVLAIKAPRSPVGLCIGWLLSSCTSLLCVSAGNQV